VNNFNAFVPENLTLAPKHPLAQNLELPIPDPQSASIETIREIQLRDRIPGVVKRMILIDAETMWEYWWCVPGRLLLAEDVKLLQQDLPRLETILEKLIGVFGGYCFHENSDRIGELSPIPDWQSIVKFAHQQGFDSYVLDIDFMPFAIRRDEGNSTVGEPESAIDRIAFEPPHWHIEFLQLTPTQGGFEIQEPKPICSCQIWTAKPFIKDATTGIMSTCYGLWLSRPLDITQPPWMK
jgi:hypothetical protein